MKFSFNNPVDIRFGRNVLKNNPGSLSLGKKAFIVTGSSSGRKSGALADAEVELRACDIQYQIFEGIKNNPNVDQCRELAISASEFGADFIIGIGGGSPLDAAKAVAVFSTNPCLTNEKLFMNEFDTPPLPIAAIPTTSGTGSEVTPWSIMTWDEFNSKKSFGNLYTYPKIALLDPSYTDSLPKDVTLFTALDAFSHCFESFLSLKASPYTDAVNLYALSRFSKCMDPLERGELKDIRDDLMLVSLLGGVAISQTGTTMMHAMGYQLTYYYGQPHGKANAIVMPVYLEEAAKYVPDKLTAALSAMGLSRNQLSSFLERNIPADFNIKSNEPAFWGKLAMKQGSVKNLPILVDCDYFTALYERIFKSRIV
ncbi:MAG: Alcohol dehydrogenase 2 [Firmicutes bacterium ADurb.Bin182]|nr:MAG: Alcohol dehydrogenase 2 [Firmicutes bacterium ADurb.Bin182]